MSDIGHHNTISLMIEYHPEDHITVGSFTWPIAQPHETYTIDASPHISVEFDRKFPVRPAAISIEEVISEGCEYSLETFIGQEAGKAFAEAASVGFCAIQLALTPVNRIALAELQIKSPSTPAHIKRACKAMLAGVHLVE